MASVLFLLESLTSLMRKAFERQASGVLGPLGGLLVDGSQALAEVEAIKTAQGS